MSGDFLPKFRRQLFDWLQHRVAGGRLPFRRVEETPRILTAKGPAAPDLVLWINRDSLLAGAMVLTPAKADEALLAQGREMAAALGLGQFVTWEARAVNIWESGAATVQLLRHRPMPGADRISADDFAIVFEQLLQDLKNLALDAVLPAGQLPPAYFANLCLQTLHDCDPALQEAARRAAGPGQTDACLARKAVDKGWLTLWRLLALLRSGRMPPGIRPERLDRALGYAFADLDRQELLHLVLSGDEPPLPESAAIRFHHLSGRLAQLGWDRQPELAAGTLSMLFAEAAKTYRVATAPLDATSAGSNLLVNHIPPVLAPTDILVAPQPCLSGWRLVAGSDRTPGSQAFDRVTAIPTDTVPARIVANLDDNRPLPPGERRQRSAALRQPWPYRRLQLAADTPAWLWDALHLGGITDPAGLLQLTLPPGWANAAAAELLWSLLGERLTLTTLQQHADGRQTLVMVGHDQLPDHLTLRLPDGTSRELPPLPDSIGPAAVAGLAAAEPSRAAAVTRPRKTPPALTERIAAKVFRDGVPRFPDHYLRRQDLPPLRTYRLPGPLQVVSHFFDRVQLAGPDGTTIDSDNPADAEALILASRDGRTEVELPVDPAFTLRLVSAYREDLLRLWQGLLDECRRHHPAQRKAVALARRLWREHDLPSVENP
ncbi:MAG: hypothetical protein FDZ69_05725 [Deltaproteobacteria bacterium]|nr:MAG: hypothetical protein FDZ69_05725 [Deltaproteobacteria bacterium]